MPMMSKRIGSLIVAVNDGINPSEAEWEAMLALIPGATGALGCSLGGAPTSAQRKRSVEQGLTALRSALLTNSTIARGVVTAFAWMGTDMRAFGPDQVEEALTFLNVPDSERPEVLSTFQLMRKAIGAL